MNKKTLAATVALTGLVVFAGAKTVLADDTPFGGFGQNEGAGQGQRGGGFLRDKWQELTSDQQTHIEDVRTQHRAEMEQLREPNRQEMHQYLLDQGIVTQEEINEMEARRAEFRENRGEGKHSRGGFDVDCPIQK